MATDIANIGSFRDRHRCPAEHINGLGVFLPVDVVGTYQD